MQRMSLFSSPGRMVIVIERDFQRMLRTFPCPERTREKGLRTSQEWEKMVFLYQREVHESSCFVMVLDLAFHLFVFDSIACQKTATL